MRLVATDLDGTVVRRDGTISARTVAAFDACRAAGVDVVVVTGRPVRWLAPVLEALGPHGSAVCGNGAVVYDLAAAEVVSTRSVTGAAVRLVVERVVDAIGPLDVVLETLPVAATPLDSRLRRVCGTDAPEVLDELLAGDPLVLKVLLRQEGGVSDDMLRVARQVLAGIAQPTHSNAAQGLLEVSALGVSKAATLADLTAARGIAAADVVAFGDMPNDVDMLRWAGHGVAVADAHPEALAAADEVAAACEDDGVAQVLEARLGRLRAS